MKSRSSSSAPGLSSHRRFAKLVAAASAAGVGWGLFEASWVRLRRLEVHVPRLPRPLDGLRIVHLSDLHLGVPSPGSHAVVRGIRWAAERVPDLVALTGDLLTHPRGEPELRHLAAQLPPPSVAVLGNHDLAIARDPLARASNLQELDPVILLKNDGVLLDVRGRSVWVAGLHPSSLYTREQRLGPNALTRDADFRILLSHFPRTLDLLEPDTFDLVLAGHMHDGQITTPFGFGKVRLAHPSARYAVGVYRLRETVMHVSPGLGTTFVPFRFGARPEATELVLRSPR